MVEPMSFDRIGNLGNSSMKGRLQEEVRLVELAQSTRVRYTDMGVFRAVAGNQWSPIQQQIHDQINCKKESYRLSSTCGAPRNHTNVPPVDAHVWRQLHLSAVARWSDSYCIFICFSDEKSQHTDYTFRWLRFILWWWRRFVYWTVYIVILWLSKPWMTYKDVPWQSISINSFQAKWKSHWTPLRGNDHLDSKNSRSASLRTSTNSAFPSSWHILAIQNCVAWSLIFSFNPS